MMMSLEHFLKGYWDGSLVAASAVKIQLGRQLRGGEGKSNYSPTGEGFCSIFPHQKHCQ